MEKEVSIYFPIRGHEIDGVLLLFFQQENRSEVNLVYIEKKKN